MVKRLVLVTWEDAWSDQENFASAHGISQTHQPMIVKTLGWVIVDDETGISMVNEQSEQDGIGVYRGRTFILRANIRNVTEYKLTVPKKKKVLSVTEPIGG